MKKLSTIAVFVLVAALILAVLPAAAQLGDTDVSSFTVQNVSGGTANVTVSFIAEDGTVYTPTDLGSGITNPFSLVNGASQQVFVPNVPSAQLPSGRYAVMISSDAQVVAQAGLAGTGSLRFTGSYVGFNGGATTFYMPTVNFNYYGWYSMLTVQNVGTAATDVTVTITCSDGTIGTLTTTGLAKMASVTWPLKSVVPNGFSASTVCEGSAVIESTGEPIVAVNNNNKPLVGATNTFEGAASGSNTLYIPNLMKNYSGWNSALTIQKLTPGTTNVTVTYSDGDTNDTCTLTDAAPSCKLIMPSTHNIDGRFSAVVTADSGEILAVAGSTKSSRGWSGGTSGVANGSAEVAVPNVSKAYYGWNSAINCQNIGSVATTLNVSYSGYEANAYDTASLATGESVQIQVFNESFLVAPWQGGATIKANAVGAEIACTVGNSNGSGAYPGDWTSQYNAYNK